MSILGPNTGLRMLIYSPRAALNPLLNDSKRMIFRLNLAVGEHVGPNHPSDWSLIRRNELISPNISWLVGGIGALTNDQSQVYLAEWRQSFLA